MKIVCVDPLLSGGKICSYTLFDENFRFLYHHISNVDDPLAQQYLNPEEYTFVCYDLFKVMELFSSQLPFQDVKTLYELLGKKFPSVIALGIETFGHERMSRYIELSDRVKAHINSYKVVSIDVSKFGEQRIIPNGLLQDLYRERASIIVDLYKLLSDEDKTFYKTFYHTIECLFKISRQPLSINTVVLDSSHFSDVIRKHTKDGKLHLKFEAVGAKTGRLSFKKGTPNLYVLPKELRKCIVARPGYSIVQLDFKSFQPRLAIYATHDEGFKSRFRNVEDIYSVFDGDREENKLLFISWMFSHMRNEKFENEAYPIKKLRSELFERMQNEGKLKNPFGRLLYYHGEKDNVVFQNYITSLEVDTVLCVMTYLYGILQPYKSRIMFPFHDALVFEIADDEDYLVEKIKNIIKDWCIHLHSSDFPVEVKSSFSFSMI